MSGDWPLPWRAWSVIAILLLANAVSFVDRQVINLLTAPLRQDLRISDTQVGLLQGVALWSCMTASCGLARNFMQLSWARVGVGVGEAAPSPAALS